MQVGGRFVGSHFGDASVDAQSAVVVHGPEQLGHIQRVAAGGVEFPAQAFTRWSPAMELASAWTSSTSSAPMRR